MAYKYPFEITQKIIDYRYISKEWMKEQLAKEEIMDEEMIEGYEKSIELYKFQLQDEDDVYELLDLFKLKKPPCIEIIRDDIDDYDDEGYAYRYYGEGHIILHLYKIQKNKRPKWVKLRSFLRTIGMCSSLRYCRGSSPYYEWY